MAVGVYQGTLRTAVIKLKQPGSEALAYSLGQLMGKWLKANAPSLDYDLIVSTPKHWWKQWQRPHNSAELLADAISYHLGKPVDHRLLRRVRLTAKQGTLQRHARAENVRRAFEIPRKHRVAGRSVLLVDDIVTSGSTMAEMTEAMYQAGARVVDVACLARGIGR
jgi:ComF family protein